MKTMEQDILNVSYITGIVVLQVLVTGVLSSVIIVFPQLANTVISSG